MPTPEDAVRVDEQELTTQEQGVVAMEAQLDAQEGGLLQMERSFAKRSQTLRSLMEYVANQESSLLTRAEAIGPRAKSLVDETLQVGGDGLDDDFGGLGALEERQVLLERRREMLALRMELVEDREQLHTKRLSAVEGAEGGFQKAEERLLSREKVIADTLRKLITQASELSQNEDDSDSDKEPALVGRQKDAAAHDLAQPDRTLAGNSETVGGKRRLKTGPLGSNAAVMVKKIDDKDGLTVEHGQVQRPSQDTAPAGARSRSENAATRRRRGRTKQGTNQFKITLEAVLGGPEKHTFFRYRADSTTDLPGLFLATPNLLREGRDVTLRIKLDSHSIETRGVVSWRRHAADGQGPPGMGIEIAELNEDEWANVGAWMKKTAPMVV